MRIITLDIDGVANSLRYAESLPKGLTFNTKNPSIERAAGNLDPLAVARLGRLAKESGASFVLSSYWRYRWETPEESVQKVKEVFQTFGVDLPLIGYTPMAGDPDSLIMVPQTRENEILEYLRQNDVSHLAILDDDGQMGVLRHWLVQTDWQYGLQDEHIEEVLATLQRPGPKV